MGIIVEVSNEEDIESALMRLRQKSSYKHKRWTKKRYGYYEKPSELRRKRKKMASIWQVRHGPHAGGTIKNSLQLFVGLKDLFARTGPNNSAGK